MTSFWWMIFGAASFGVFLAILAYNVARLEIEIEGPVGWALAGPTFQKRSRLYALLMAGKTLTGYHRIMFFLPMLWFLGFGLLPPFLWGSEISGWQGYRLFLGHAAELLAYLFCLYPIWDFMWFPLNPNFGIENFRRGRIFWHMRWVTNRIPEDYPATLVPVTVFGVTAMLLQGDGFVWLRLGIVIAILLVGVVITVKRAPRIQQWTRDMQNQHPFDETDWSPWLTAEEMARLRASRDEMNRLRFEIGELGKLRAHREQVLAPRDEWPPLLSRIK